MKGDRKIGFVCSHGGHLVEVLQLMEGLGGYPHFLLTYDEKAASSLEKTYTIRNFARNPVSILSGFFKILSIFLRERPEVLLSTGAEIALPAFYIGKFLFRTKLIYMECSAQVHTPSLTGRLVYPISDLFLVQWESLLRRYGPKAKYVGGLI